MICKIIAVDPLGTFKFVRNALGILHLTHSNFTIATTVLVVVVELYCPQRAIVFAVHTLAPGITHRQA